MTSGLVQNCEVRFPYRRETLYTRVLIWQVGQVRGRREMSSKRVFAERPSDVGTRRTGRLGLPAEEGHGRGLVENRASDADWRRGRAGPHLAVGEKTRRLPIQLLLVLQRSRRPSEQIARILEKQEQRLDRFSILPGLGQHHRCADLPLRMLDRRNHL